MYFWLKFWHIAAMTVWFAGLFFLPRLCALRLEARGTDPEPGLRTLGRTLYFHLMTPAAVIAVSLGTVLVGYGVEGAWLPAKVCLVALAVLLHVYDGQLLVDLDRAHPRHGAWIYRALAWSPLPLLLGIAALAAAKPHAVPPFGAP